MKKPKAPRLVTVAVTTTITIIFWIFFTLYQLLITKPSSSVDASLLEPIDPTLDTDTLGTLSERTFFEEGGFAIPVDVSTPSGLTPTPTTSEEPTLETPLETTEVEIPEEDFEN